MAETAGIVLAGGYSRRFGDRDKILAPLDGRPLIAHAVDSLDPVADDVIVSCREDQIESIESVLDNAVFRPDRTPDGGPLAGLATALDGVDATSVAVTTADRPCVPQALYRFLLDTLSREGVVILSSGILQPAPAAFRTDALRASVEKKQSRDETRLLSVLEPLELTTIPVTEIRQRWHEDVLADVNNPADLDAIRDRPTSE